jgi:hypothetical protein
MSLGACPCVAGISSWDRGHWGSLAGSNVLLCQHRPSRLVSKGWAPRTKGSHLMYPCKQVTEAIKLKNMVEPVYGYMQFYRLLHPSATWPSIPSAMWPSSPLNSLGFISLLCHPFPPCYFIRTQPVCFSSGPPPCYIIPHFDARTHLGSKSIILI